MNFRDYMINNIDNLCKVRDLVLSLNPYYIKKTIYNEKELSNNTVSIVMTTHNRRKQTLFTLDIFTKSDYKDLQVIIVDDYEEEQFTADDFLKYPYQIEYIRIQNKFWINACVNYNIGFQCIKGGIVIIQNAEVCHVGDIITHLVNNIKDNQYIVYDIMALMNHFENGKLYSFEKLEIPHLLKNLNCYWYEHYKFTPRNFHFLTALTRNTFNEIKGFDLDYAMGSCWDDDDFAFFVTNHPNINVIHMKNDEDQQFGIHQFHDSAACGEAYEIKNKKLFEAKVNYFKIHRKKMSLLEGDFVRNLDKLFIKN